MVNPFLFNPLPPPTKQVARAFSLVRCGVAAIGLSAFLALVACQPQVPSNATSPTDSPAASAELKTAQSKPSTPSPQPSNVQEVPLKALLAAFKTNKTAATTTYQGQWVGVSGFVEDKGKNSSGDTFVTLGTGNLQEISVFEAYFEPASNDKLAAVKKGQKITLVCQIAQPTLNVIGKFCNIQ